MTPPPAPTPNGAGPKARPTARSDAAWSATWPASSTGAWRPTPALTLHRWHVSGTPPLGAARWPHRIARREPEEVPMAIVGGLDIHRRQITYDWVDTDTGQARHGRIQPAPVSSYGPGLLGWLGS